MRCGTGSASLAVHFAFHGPRLGFATQGQMTGHLAGRVAMIAVATSAAAADAGAALDAAVNKARIDAHLEALELTPAAIWRLLTKDWTSIVILVSVAVVTSMLTLWAMNHLGLMRRVRAERKTWGPLLFVYRDNVGPYESALRAVEGVEEAFVAWFDSPEAATFPVDAEADSCPFILTFDDTDAVQSYRQRQAVGVAIRLDPEALARLRRTSGGQPGDRLAQIQAKWAKADWVRERHYKVAVLPAQDAHVVQFTLGGVLSAQIAVWRVYPIIRPLAASCHVPHCVFELWDLDSKKIEFAAPTGDRTAMLPFDIEEYFKREAPVHFGDTLDNANKSVTARRAGRERSAALGLQGLDPSGGGMGQLERGGGSGEVPRLSPQGSGMEAGLEAMLAKEEDGDEEGVGEGLGGLADNLRQRVGVARSPE